MPRYLIITCLLVSSLAFAETPTESSHCPDCNAELNKVPIVYGEASPEMMEQEKRGELLLGGCFYSPNSPEYPNYAFICPECKKVIERQFIEELKEQQNNRALQEITQGRGDSGTPIIGVGKQC